MLEYKNIKTFLQKAIFLIVPKKLKILWRGHVINDLNSEKVFGRFYEKELQTTNQKEFRVEKSNKEKR